MKVCTQCGETKPLEDYYANGRQPCKPCHRMAMKAYREANPDKVRRNRQRWGASEAGREWATAYRDANRQKLRARERERDLMRTYGLTLGEYEDMSAAQGDQCAICGLSETSIHHRSKEPRALAVDHNHETGAVRALLCNRCNQAIGLLDDDPVLLIAAAVYLQLHNTPVRRSA